MSKKESKKDTESKGEEKKNSPKKSATTKPKKAPKKKPEFKKSDYKCAICEEPYKAGTKHWKSKQKSRIPGLSISQNMYNITKDLKERYKSKEDIPKTHRLCAVCYKEKVVPLLPKKTKTTTTTKEKSSKK